MEILSSTFNKKSGTFKTTKICTLHSNRIKLNSRRSFQLQLGTSIWHHVRQHSNIKWTYASASFLHRWRVSSDACSFGYLKSVLEFKLSISMCEKELWESMRLQVQTSRNLNDSDYTKKKRRKWNATCRKMKDQITKRKIIQFILFGKTNWWEQTIKLLFYRIKK